MTTIELVRQANLVKMIERLKAGNGRGSIIGLCHGIECWECPLMMTRCRHDYEKAEENLCEMYIKMVEDAKRKEKEGEV